MGAVTNAIARRDEAAANAPARVEERDVVRSAIATMTDALTDLLPDGMSEARFGTLVVSACKATPDLMRCFDTKQGRTSVLLSTVQAASLGLEPNTPTEECWLNPRRIKGTWECQLQIGYKGYLKLALRSPRVKSVRAKVVYEADHFVYEEALPDPIFEHRPSTLPEAERGPLTHAYCVVSYLSGGYSLTVLDRDQVHKRRDKSDGWKADERRTDGKQFNPWNVWEPDMWRKTAIRAARAFMDLTPQTSMAFESDSQRLTYDRQADRITATLDGPIDAPEPEAIGTGSGSVAHEGPAPRMATKPQLTAVNTLLGTKLGATGDARFFELDELFPDREQGFTSTSELTFDEAGWLIEHLGSLPDKAPVDDVPGGEPFEETS